jgi:hypothetical protein
VAALKLEAGNADVGAVLEAVVSRNGVAAGDTARALAQELLALSHRLAVQSDLAILSGEANWAL